MKDLSVSLGCWKRRPGTSVITSWVEMSLLLLASTAAAAARSPPLDYDFSSSPPQFVTEPRNFSVREGESLELPCQTRDLGSYKAVWRKGMRIISAGHVVAIIDPRFQLVRDNSLKIDGVRRSDQGAFVCSISTDPVMELTHLLDVLYGPAVVTRPETGLVVAEKGADVTLECTASGKPEPQVAWRKQSGALPGGQSTQLGERYQLQDITRQMAGVYECVADNGRGQTAVGRISLQVQYEPEVEVERSTVYTGEGYSIKLTCFVLADPPAKVVWSRESSPLDPERHIASDDVAMTTRHSLTISRVQQDDFATYSCKATNSLGTMNRRMVVTGVADRVQVTSAAVGSTPTDYDLSWEVESFGPISEYKVAYRRSRFNSSVVAPSVWKEVIVPTTGTEPIDEVRYHQRITLRKLAPATPYELYIQARNGHGWNAVSELFHFSTLSRGEALESRIAATGGSGRRRVHPLLGALLVIVYIILPAIF